MNLDDHGTSECAAKPDRCDQIVHSKHTTQPRIWTTTVRSVGLRGAVFDRTQRSLRMPLGVRTPRCYFPRWPRLAPAFGCHLCFACECSLLTGDLFVSISSLSDVVNPRIFVKVEQGRAIPTSTWTHSFPAKHNIQPGLLFCYYFRFATTRFIGPFPAPTKDYASQAITLRLRSDSHLSSGIFGRLDLTRLHPSSHHQLHAHHTHATSSLSSSSFPSPRFFHAS